MTFTERFDRFADNLADRLGSDIAAFLVIYVAFFAIMVVGFAGLILGIEAISY